MVEGLCRLQRRGGLNQLACQELCGLYVYGQRVTDRVERCNQLSCKCVARRVGEEEAFPSQGC